MHRCSAAERPASRSWQSRAIPLAPATVRRYASMETAPERGGRRIGSSQLDPWLAYLERRRAEGCENGLQLLRELRERGYAGGSRQVHKWLQGRRTKVAITTPRRCATRWPTPASSTATTRWTDEHERQAPADDRRPRDGTG